MRLLRRLRYRIYRWFFGQVTGITLPETEDFFTAGPSKPTKS